MTIQERLSACLSHLEDDYPQVVAEIRTEVLTGPRKERIGRIPDSHAKWSPREAEVAGHKRAGLSNKEIADRCGITVGTVKIHMKNAFAKCGV